MSEKTEIGALYQLLRRYPRATRWTLYVAIPSLVIICAAFFLLEKKEESLIQIPVRLANVPPNLVALPDVSVIEIRVRGPAERFEGFKERILDYTIDLSKATSGSLPVRVEKDAVSVPPKLSVLSVHPEFLTVHVEPRCKKRVCVIADLLGDPLAGYAISKVAVDPSIVELSGPYAELDGLTAIRTTPIDISRLTETSRKKVALALPPRLHIRPVDLGLVDVEIIVEEKGVAKSFDIQVEGGNTPYPYVINPSSINISIKGPAKTIEKLAHITGEPRAFINLKGLGPGIYVRNVRISLPVDVFLTDAQPEVFTVRITKMTEE